MNYLIVPIGWLQFWLFWGLAILFFISLIRALTRERRRAGVAARANPGSVSSSSRLDSYLRDSGGVRIALPLLSPAALAGALGGAAFDGRSAVFVRGKLERARQELEFRGAHERRSPAHPQRALRPRPSPDLSRHALFLLGLATALGHYAQLILAIPIFLIGTTIRTRIEDGLLEAQFGQDFRDYAKSTPPLIPRIS